MTNAHSTSFLTSSQSNNRGLTLLELMVALAIGGVFVAALSRPIMLAAQSAASLQLHLEHSATLTETYNQLRMIVDGYDSHRLPIQPRIINRWPLTYADDTTVSWRPSSPWSAPDQNSPAIVGLVLRSAAAEPVRNSDTYENNLNFQVSNYPRPHWLEHALGCTIDRCLELECSAVDNTVHCHAARHSMFITHQDYSALPFIRTLIPIANAWVLYKSERGELRRLSFIGERTTENQPLSRGLNQLTFSLSTKEFGILNLESVVNVAGEKPFAIHLQSHLSRARLISAALGE